MKDQERLKKIDDLLESYYASEDGFEQTDLAISIIQGHVNWLKQQAEEKQELEEALEDIRDHCFDETAARIAEKALEETK